MPETFLFKHYKLPADQPPDNAFPSGHLLHLPIIEIKVQLGSRVMPSILALVDSGASYCAFDDTIANSLRIPVTSGNLKRELTGIGGTSVDAYFFNVDLLIKSTRLTCYAAFLNQPFPKGYPQSGLIGNYDFLNKLKATLDEPTGVIVIG